MTAGMVAHAEAANPYRGLVPYTEEDASLFFGRERARALVESNVLASRLTLLYGPSGVGKSSLLLAAVIPHLRERGSRRRDAGRPEVVPIAFGSWHDDPVAGLRVAIAEASAAVLDGYAIEPFGAIVDMVDELARRVDGRVVLVLDQLEEYFVYYGAAADAAFVGELAACVSRPRLRASFLLTIREDALGQLDRFAERIPQLYGNALRMEHPTRSEARQAIERPLERAGFRTEPELVEAVLDQVQIGRIAFGESGFGSGREEARVEPAFLQLVMRRLWEHANASGINVIRRETLDALGGAELIVRTHVDTALADFDPVEREVAAALFHYLVTPSGTRVAHAASDLAEYASLPLHRVAAVLDGLAFNRIVRPVGPPSEGDGETRWEIFHNVLVPAVVDWRNARREAARGAELLRRARLRAQLVFATMLLVIVAETIWLLVLYASR